MKKIEDSVITEELVFEEAQRLKMEFNELNLLISTLSIGLGIADEAGEIIEWIQENPAVSEIEQFYGMPIIMEYYVGKFLDTAKDLDNIYYIYEAYLKENQSSDQEIQEKLETLYTTLDNITSLPEEEYYLAVYNYDGNEYDIREDDPELRS